MAKVIVYCTARHFIAGMLKDLLLNEGWFGNSTPIANFFGVSLNYYEPPRTFGGELSYRF